MSRFEVALWVIGGLGYVVLLLTWGVLRYKSFDRRDPRCPSELGGLQCQRTKNHDFKPHYYRTGFGPADAVEWPTSYVPHV